MTSQNFSRPGAIDLSGLAAAAAVPAAATSRPGAFVVDLTEESFDAVVRQSLQVPVVLELTSPRAHGAEQMSADLEALSDEGAGAWLLARVDVDAQPRLAQALGIQAVPMLVAIIGGQPATLFQGTKPRDEIRPYIDEVLQAALANGIVGRAKPGPGRAGESTPAGEQEPVDPRFAAADEAMAAGDFARAADADDIDAQLDAADLELINARPEAAFARLIDVIRDTAGDDRERVRVRLLELFETVGRSDPTVVSARRALSSALF